MKLEIDSDQLASELAPKLAKILKPIMEKDSIDNDIIFTVETLAEYLTVSKQWVYEKVRFNEIPYSKMGKFPRFKKSVIDKWLEEKNVPVVKSVGI